MSYKVPKSFKGLIRHYKVFKEAYNVPKVAALSEPYEAPREPYKVAKRSQGLSKVLEVFRRAL